MAKNYWPVNFVALLLLCMGSRLVHYSSAAFSPDELCTLIKNGTRVKDPRACNAWIECINGQPIAGQCDGENFYDRETGLCVAAESIKCISSNPCATTISNQVFVADPYSCNGYYYCEDGDASHGSCQPGMNFNPGTLNCVRNFPCENKMDPDSYCNIVPDNIFVKDSANCNGYSVCWNGEIVNGTCPGIFYFNAFNGTCDDRSKVDCKENPSNKPNVDVCQHANEFVSDDNTCNGYYLCYTSAAGDMQLIHGLCGNSRFFYAQNGSCVGRTQIACQYDRCAAMGTNGIELANASADGCHGYLICQNGVTIGSGICPDNQYFDEMQQRCTTQTIAYPACTVAGSDSVASTDRTTAGGPTGDGISMPGK